MQKEEAVMLRKQFIALGANRTEVFAAKRNGNSSGADARKRRRKKG